MAHRTEEQRSSTEQKISRRHPKAKVDPDDARAPAPEAAPRPPKPKADCVDQASWESFPASDPPSWTGTTAG